MFRQENKKFYNFALLFQQKLFVFSKGSINIQVNSIPHPQMTIVFNGLVIYIYRKKMHLYLLTPECWLENYVCFFFFFMKSWSNTPEKLLDFNFGVIFLMFMLAGDFKQSYHKFFSWKGMDILCNSSTPIISYIYFGLAGHWNVTWRTGSILLYQ